MAMGIDCRVHLHSGDTNEPLNNGAVRNAVRVQKVL